MSSLEIADDDIEFIVYDKNNEFVKKYTLPFEIAIQKAKFFDNNFGQTKYEYKNDSLTKDTLKMVFNKLFYESDSFVILDFDTYIHVYQMFDYLIVPNIPVLLPIYTDLFKDINNFDTIVTFAKTCKLTFDSDFPHCVPNSINNFDVLICTGDANRLDNYGRKQIYKRYLENINSDEYNKYLTPQNRKDIESHFIENDYCHYIFDLLNKNNIKQMMNIMKSCKHHNGCFNRNSDYWIGRIKPYFTSYDFEDAYCLLEIYLIHHKFNPNPYNNIEKDIPIIIGSMFEYFKDKGKEYLELCEKFLLKKSDSNDDSKQPPNDVSTQQYFDRQEPPADDGWSHADPNVASEWSEPAAAAPVERGAW